MHPSSVTLDTSCSSVTGAENWRVPSIRPLETLHNALTLNQMETFLKKMTDNMVCQTPAWSPKAPSTPCLTPKTTPSSGNLSLPFSQGEKERANVVLFAHHILISYQMREIILKLAGGEYKSLLQ